MSTEIEQRVLEMQFDNKQFERNVSTTMSSLDKLKQSLNLTGAAKGLEGVGTAARGINLSGLTSAAETVGLKFNAMWTIADQALRNITNSAYYAGKRIISSFTIDPVKTGFSEYETQINAVQTILANTKSKGTNIDDVNKALDELNTYADKTIYNFTEMTRNIGTFTAAGVDLDKSVTSIKGIANLAAVSGSSSQQASTAMYQLSQALAAGKVSLMDWNSVVNAGMGGEVFQEALKRTARNMGTDVDAIIKKYGSFRESLTQGEWLTTDVLTETLTQLSGAYTEADLLAKGYSESQAKEILDLAETAESAATDVKTFTQLMDTLKESAQSGWTQTWEILVGDFEEAKGTLSKVSKVIGDMIGRSAEARNNLLQGWKDEGGRDDLLAGIKNAFDGLMNIISPIKRAFRDIFPPTTSKQLVKITSAFKDLTSKFVDFTVAVGPKIYDTFKGVFSVIDIGWTFVKELAGGIVDLIGHFTGLGGGILGVTATIGDWLTNVRDAIKEADIFGITVDKIVGFLSGIIDKFKDFGKSIKSVFKSPGAKGFFEIMKGIWNVIVKIGSKVGEIFAPLGKAVANLFGNASFTDLLNDGLFAAILIGINKFISNLNGPLGSIKDLFDGLTGEDGIIGGVKGILDSVRGCFEAYQNSLNAEVLKKIAVSIAILAASIFVLSSIDADALDRALGSITILFADLMASLAIFTKMNLGGKGLIKGSTAIVSLASAVLVLSLAMKIMSTMSWEEIAIGITGTVAGLGALVLAVNLLPANKVSKSARSIGKLATALVILAAGMKIMASMNWNEMGVAITGVVAGLGALVAAVRLLPKDTALRSLGMVGLATSMVILSGALKLMGSMSWDEIAHGLAAMGGALGELVLTMQLMPRDLGVSGVGMIGLATAIVILGTALKSMSGMSWDEIAHGLVAMGGALIEIAIALNLMRGTVTGSAALLVAAGALAVLTPVLKSLGKMSLKTIGTGLLAMAGAFAVIGVAGMLLAPVVPAILGLAAAMTLFGIATIGIGAGCAAIAYGFTALAAAGTVGATALVAAIGAIIVGVIDLIPSIASGLAEAVVALCDMLIEVAPKLAETLLVLISEVMAQCVTYIPQITDLVLKLFIGVLNALAENMPDLISAAMDVLGSFFQGVIDALSEVDTDTLVETIAGVGLVTAIIMALSALSATIPAAMTGVLGMGVVMAELAAVLAAVGGIAQIPGLEWLINEGGDFLQSIGTAIGQFVGGIVGGIAEGATAALPAIGSNLGNFMTNLQPFLDGLAAVNQDTLDKAVTLAGAILTLTASDLLASIAAFFSGGSSLDQFAQVVVPLGQIMKDYSDKVKGIDTKAIGESVTIAEKLFNLAGQIGFVWGDAPHNMESYGKDIVAFAQAMKDYANEIADIDTTAIITSLPVIRGVMSLFQGIPGDGLFGTDGIDDFGDNIAKFGKSMKKYSNHVVDIDSAAITASIPAVRGLISVAKQIPSDGLFGTDGIDDFGDNLVDFAKSMKKYANKIEDIDTGMISKSIQIVRQLINMINSTTSVNTKGVASFATAMNDLGKVNMNGFVKSFSAATPKLTGLGKNMFESITRGIQSTKPRFIAVVRTTIETAITNIDKLSIRFKVSGIEMISKLINGVLSGKTRVTSAFTSALSAALTAINGYRSSFYTAGGYLAIGFANGISANRYKAAAQAKAMAAAAANAAKKELDEHSPSKVGYGIGDFFGIAFVNGIADNVKRAYSASQGMANAAKSGLKGAFDKVLGIISGEIEVSPTVRPVIDLTDVKSGANAINGMFGLTPSVGVLAHVGAVSSMMNQRNQAASNADVVYAINKLHKALGNVGNTYNSIGNVTYDDGSNIAEAIRIIADAALRERRV
jgi:tape measure domain-containing protein